MATKKTALEHRELISSLFCSLREWQQTHYPTYKDQGYLNSPTLSFDHPWRWFKGIDEMADANQHREWISKHQYDVEQWRKEGYPQYKHEGALYYPPRAFNLPWSWFLGEEMQTVDYSLPKHFYTDLNAYRERLGYDDKIKSIIDNRVWNIGFLIDSGIIGDVNSISIIDEGTYYFTYENYTWFFEFVEELE